MVARIAKQQDRKPFVYKSGRGTRASKRFNG